MKLERYKTSHYVGWIDPRFDCDDLRLLLENPGAVGTFEGAEPIPGRPGRTMHRITISSPSGPCLVYTHLLVNRRIVEMLRPPKAYSVLRTGRKMLACGLPTSRVLAAVRPRWMPLNRSSFAVTLGIPDAVPLSMLEPDEFRGRIGGFKKLHLIRQIATQTAWMHAHGFYHKDLVAQNILVARRRETPVIWFVGLSQTGIIFWRPPYVRQWRWASDLLALMRSEIRAINARDRVVFLETYLRALGPERGAETVKKILLRRMEE
jgi:hypothetical protein